VPVLATAQPPNPSDGQEWTDLVTGQKWVFDASLPGWRKQRLRKPRGGIPEPLKFDIRAVPRSHRLSLIEVAASVRRSAQTVRLWTRQSDAPLELFKTRDGFWMSTVGDVLDYLDGPSGGGKQRLRREAQAKLAHANALEARGKERKAAPVNAKEK
jgi:hypothetical protein